MLANDNVNFDLRKGEVHALLGENGAGKTTLMNILYGLNHADSGTIEVFGKEVSINTPSDALALNIGMVHQHFMLVQPFTVTDNIVLGNEIHSVGVLRHSAAKTKVLSLSKEYGFDVDPESHIRDISVAMQQRVELLRILYQGAEILILDEPTAVLSPQEIEEFGSIVKRLTQSGKSIIIITHKLKEIIDFADRCTVISRGKIIDTVDVQDVSSTKLANMMVGHEVDFSAVTKKNDHGKLYVSIKDVYAQDDRNYTTVKGVSLDVYKNEIVALAGVDGNGQRELIEVLAGVREMQGGSISLGGTAIQDLSPREKYQAGCVNIPEDRHRDGLVLPYSITNNIALRSYRSYIGKLFLHFDDMNRDAERLIQDFSIYPSDPEHIVGEMSGGNQQKVIIARELCGDPSFIVAAHPTRGLDVGAARYVHEALVHERDKGAAVLLVSFDLDEIFQIADKIAIIYNGEIIEIKLIGDVTREQIGLGFAGIAT